MNKKASTRIRGARLKFSLVWSGRSPFAKSIPLKCVQNMYSINI